MLRGIETSLLSKNKESEKKRNAGHPSVKKGMLIWLEKTEGVFFLKLINVPGKKTKLTTLFITQKWSTYFRVRQV
jgi:hypothetical protein